MVATIGPFWDANETWLVLGIGLLLVAFPAAHGIVLTALYLPVALMLLGLTLRGVAFEFRVKAQQHHQNLWDIAFVAGSTLASLTQGYMLGRYVMGFRPGVEAEIFALLSAFGLAAAYAFVGATWLIAKTEGELQERAVRWARTTLILTALGILVVSVATPLVSDRIFERWFTFPNIIGLAPIPLMTAALFAGLWVFLARMPRADHSLDLVPFLGAVGLCPWLPRPRLFVLPLCGAGATDDLAGRERAGKPAHHPDRGAVRAADDPRLHGVQLLRVPRQGVGTALRLNPGA